TSATRPAAQSRVASPTTMRLRLLITWVCLVSSRKPRMQPPPTPQEIRFWPLPICMVPLTLTGKLWLAPHSVVLRLGARLQLPSKFKASTHSVSKEPRRGSSHWLQRRSRARSLLLSPHLRGWFHSHPQPLLGLSLLRATCRTTPQPRLLTTWASSLRLPQLRTRLRLTPTAIKSYSSPISMARSTAICKPWRASSLERRLLSTTAAPLRRLPSLPSTHLLPTQFPSLWLRRQSRAQLRSRSLHHRGSLTVR